jgi:hypothetical protein
MLIALRLSGISAINLSLSLQNIFTFLPKIYKFFFISQANMLNKDMSWLEINKHVLPIAIKISIKG